MIDLGPFPDQPGYDEARSLDEADPLRFFRDRFVITDPDLIYLDGNSLGRLPKATSELLPRVVDREWGDRVIRSWNDEWWDLQLRLGDKLAGILGAGPGEVIVSDSTSVNLYKLALAAVESAGPGRSRIVTDDMNFPTDVYVLDGVARSSGGELVVVPVDPESDPDAAIAAAVDKRTALVSLSHTSFKSGYTYDMAAVTGAAHEVGALVLWDCSHSVGALPIDLEACGVDLAVGCTYKYLNGGPGSPAWLYARRPHQERLANPIPAWWGHAEPFAFDLGFRPVDGIRRFHTGTMPILSLAAIEPGIDIVIEAGTELIRAKSLALSDFLIAQADEHLAPLGLEVASPRRPEVRGSHVSLANQDAWPITKAMIELAQVIPDFRTPDNIRLGLAPLYTEFLDIHTAVHRIRALVETRAYLAYIGATAVVT
jgi:kynureninase